MRVRSIASTASVVVLVAGLLGAVNPIADAGVETAAAATLVTDRAEVNAYAQGDQADEPTSNEDSDEDFRDFTGNVTAQSEDASSAATQSTQVAGPGNEVTSVSSHGTSASSGNGGIDDAQASSHMDVILELDQPTPYTLDVQASATSDSDLGFCTGVLVRLETESADNHTVEIADGGGSCGAGGSVNQSFDGVLEATSSVHVDSGSGALGGETASTSFDVTLTIGEQCDNEFTDGTDTITGTDEDEVLCGGEGNDTIEGGGGADTIHGGDGTDELSGNGGSDTIFGDLGNDVIGEVAGFNDGVVDTVHGCNDEQPLCNASEAALNAAGQSDNDIITVDSGGSLIHGGAERDTLIGGIGSDEIHGGPARDDIAGEVDFADPEPGSPDLLEGGPGNDTIDAGPGNDEPVNGPWGVFGGPGNDTITGGFGDDRLDGGSGEDRINGDLGNDGINGGDDDDFDILQGCNFREQLCNASDAALAAAGFEDLDVITAGGGRSLVDGNAGTDWLIGAGAHDNLDGGPGGDLIEAGGGRDTVIGGTGDDELKGQGGDESGPRIGQVVIRILGGPGDDEMFGGGGDDLLEAEDGDDVLAGDQGRDTLRGHSGEDCLAGGLGRDVFAGGGGGDKLVARDQTEDVVNGGPNFDRARVDSGLDNVTGVENRQLIEACAV